jgi:hypothetical protein
VLVILKLNLVQIEYIFLISIFGDELVNLVMKKHNLLNNGIIENALLLGGVIILL